MVLDGKGWGRSVERHGTAFAALSLEGPGTHVILYCYHLFLLHNLPSVPSNLDIDMPVGQFVVSIYLECFYNECLSFAVENSRTSGQLRILQSPLKCPVFCGPVILEVVLHKRPPAERRQ